MTIVRPKCVSWRSNQEWRSIGVDSVCFYICGLVPLIYLQNIQDGISITLEMRWEIWIPKKSVAARIIKPMHTVSAQIERHSWLERQETHFGRTMVNFGEKSSENTVIFDDFSSKITIVRTKCVSWRSNQEWHSICGDTVCQLIANRAFKVSQFSDFEFPLYTFW